MWTWFNDPRAIEAGGEVFVGAIQSDGDVTVAHYDGDAKAFDTPFVLHPEFEVDDHDNPSLLCRASDQRLMAFYCRHGNDTNMYYRVSTNPLDASAWDAEVNIGSQIGSMGNLTYTNPVQLTGETNDPIYLFFRSSTVDFPYTLSYTKSEDDGATWGAGVRLLTDRRSYFHVVQNGDDRIDIVCNDGHPDEEENVSTYHFYYQGGNFYKTDGTLIGAVGDAPFTCATDLTLIFDGSTAAGESWVWDIAIDNGQPVVVFANFPDPNTDHRYRYGRWNGSAWVTHEICTAGAWIYSSQPHYSGGVAIDHSNPNVVYASRELNDIFQLFRYTTSDGGETWDEHQMTTSKALRPIVVRGRTQQPRLMYWTGTYGPYTAFDTDIVFRWG